MGIAGGINEGLIIKKGEVIRKVKEEDLLSELKKKFYLIKNNWQGLYGRKEIF